jgi:hypothetical protein
MSEHLEQFYDMIERMKSVGVYEYIGPTINKVVFLYNKRFGDIIYANSIETDELCEQVEDCLNHFVCEDTNVLNLISIMTEDEKAMFMAAMIQFIIEPDETDDELMQQLFDYIDTQLNNKTPTKVSQLDNDKHYITQENLDSTLDNKKYVDESYVTEAINTAFANIRRAEEGEY